MLSAIAAMLALSSQAGPALSAKLFKGHGIKVTGVSDRDHPPAGPISVCIEIAPRPACYVAAKEYSYNPNVQLVQLTTNEPAILFSSENYGMAGWGIKFAILRLNQENKLEDILADEVIVSNQSQHSIWDEKSDSNSKMFVTASYVSGPNEARHEPHRYVISTYRRKEPAYPADTNDSYYLRDQYMTAGKYNLDTNPQLDILKAERAEILGRLARIKQAETKTK